MRKSNIATIQIQAKTNDNVDEWVNIPLTPVENKENINSNNKTNEHSSITPQWSKMKRLGSQILSQVRREKIVGKVLSFE